MIEEDSKWKRAKETGRKMWNLDELKEAKSKGPRKTEKN